MHNDNQKLKKDLDYELNRSNPDIVIYKPKFEGEKSGDNGNEHFLVFEAPYNGDMLAVWTQSTYEGSGDHRIMTARSKDKGMTWGAPKKIAGSDKPEEGLMASWGFPIVSSTGRIYCFWNQYQGINDYQMQTTGTLDCSYSDDNGENWSSPVTLSMPRSIKDNPDDRVPSNWIVWQKPGLDSKGRWLAGFTRWTSNSVCPESPVNHWVGHDSAVEFMRFENINDGLEPNELKISFLQAETGGLRVNFPSNKDISLCQEPSFVKLPDNRLFMTMRTVTGLIWYSVSENDGETWRTPDILRMCDFGEPLLQPASCCPIYSLKDGRYILLYHNNARNYDTVYQPIHRNRQPAFIALGEYRKDSIQPIWFSSPKKFLDNDDVPLGPMERSEIGVYTSLTEVDGKRILWYPDRKFFLLGKIISDKWLEDMKVRE
jgi:hypothetical protein